MQCPKGVAVFGIVVPDRFSVNLHPFGEVGWILLFQVGDPRLG